MLQACINGALTKTDHPAVPMSAEELARDAAACVAAGAGSIHIHPRDTEGRETLEADVVDEVVQLVRKACGVPICVSTGAWIEPDLGRRIELIRGWRQPDLATVNVPEEGSAEVMAALLKAGVEIEAGIWSPADVERFMATGLAQRVARILVEPVEVRASDAENLVSDIHGRLDGYGLRAPRLQHGDGGATWILIADAVRRGVDTRVGFEDTFYGPDGEGAEANDVLVRAARAMGAGA